VRSWEFADSQGDPQASGLRFDTGFFGAALFSCPACEKALEASGHDLQCRFCYRRWRVKDGVPHFGGEDHRPSILTDVQRREVVQAAVDRGWEVAVHDVLCAIDRLAYRRAIDEYRAQWRFVLPLSPSDHVLDLNCTWGAVTFNLAEICALVVAADPCSEHVRFVAQRARQKGQNNIVPLQLGLDQSLPFLARHFETVIMIDSLSWLSDVEKQRAILRRIRKVIKAGGCLFLADTNRLSFVDPLARASAGTPHTLRGYKTLLRSVGFRRLREYVLAPSHMEPFFILPLDRSRPLEFFLREIIARQDFGMHFRSGPQKFAFRMARAVAQRGPTRLLARLARPFLPSFAIVAQA
jgi:SAM-dependent methyltransferase